MNMSKEQPKTPEQEEAEIQEQVEVLLVKVFKVKKTKAEKFIEALKLLPQEKQEATLKSLLKIAEELKIQKEKNLHDINAVGNELRFFSEELEGLVATNELETDIQNLS